MGAAALTLRWPVLRARREPVDAALAFNHAGGPVVAICALTGGSGASTLAIALAAQVARASRTPTLLTEADSHAGGLSALTGRASPLGLFDLANTVGDEPHPVCPFVELEPRLRLLATPPRRDPDVQPEALDELLGHARDAHGLVVVDCGTAWPAHPQLLARATHIVWMLPATEPAVTRARAIWAAGLAPSPGRRREALVVSAITRQATASVRALRRLAATRCHALVMRPYDARLASGGSAREARVDPPLQALASFLRREAR